MITAFLKMTTAIYCHTDCLAHEMGSWHPESPARLQAIDVCCRKCSRDWTISAGQ